MFNFSNAPRHLSIWNFSELHCKDVINKGLNEGILDVPAELRLIETFHDNWLIISFCLSTCSSLSFFTRLSGWRNFRNLMTSLAPLMLILVLTNSLLRWSWSGVALGRNWLLESRSINQSLKQPWWVNISSLFALYSLRTLKEIVLDSNPVFKTQFWLLVSIKIFIIREVLLCSSNKNWHEN